MRTTVAVYLLFLSVAGAHPGVGIVMDSKGNVYYTDLHHIWKIDVKDQVSIAVHNVHSHELYMDESDNLYGEHLWYEGEATNTWGHYVWKLSAGDKLGKIIQPTEGFLKNYSFVRDHSGNMYWAERDVPCQKVVRKNVNHAVSRLSEACLHNVRWMHVAASGNIYLTDNEELKKIDQGGHIETMTGELVEKKSLRPDMAWGIWSDKNENIYVAIYESQKVKKITPDKKVSVVAQTSGMWSPVGGLVAPNGDFWLLENSTFNKMRVEKITAGGKRIVYANRSK